VPYFTAAAALGLTEADVDAFISKLDGAVKDYKKLLRRSEPGGGSSADAVAADGDGST
jgi:hypothetical protein